MCKRVTHTSQISSILPPTYRGAEGFNESWHPLAIGVLHVGHRYLLTSELVVLPPNVTAKALDVKSRVSMDCGYTKP